MKAEIQIPIEGIPYAFVKYQIEAGENVPIWLLHAKISEDIKSAPKELTPQNSLEIDTLRSMLEDTTEKSEMKSRIIEKLKIMVWDEEFNKVREEVINSPEFQAITKHKNNDSDS